MTTCPARWPVHNKLGSSRQFREAAESTNLYLTTLKSFSETRGNRAEKGEQGERSAEEISKGHSHQIPEYIYIFERNRELKESIALTKKVWNKRVGKRTRRQRACTPPNWGSKRPTPRGQCLLNL